MKRNFWILFGYCISYGFGICDGLTILYKMFDSGTSSLPRDLPYHIPALFHWCSIVQLGDILSPAVPFTHSDNLSGLSSFNSIKLQVVLSRLPFEIFESLSSLFDGFFALITKPWFCFFCRAGK